jgi:hypothetical protein
VVLPLGVLVTVTEIGFPVVPDSVRSMLTCVSVVWPYPPSTTAEVVEIEEVVVDEPDDPAFRVV